MLWSTVRNQLQRSILSWPTAFKPILKDLTLGLYIPVKLSNELMLFKTHKFYYLFACLFCGNFDNINYIPCPDTVWPNYPLEIGEKKIQRTEHM